MSAFSRLAVAFTAVAVVSGATAAPAAAAVKFTSAWFLGDSLSDDGNRYAWPPAGTTPPIPPYYQGRYSNGPVWAEYIAQDSEDANLPTGNYAYGGATAVTNADGVPDLAAQIGLFAADSVGKLGVTPVAHLFFGANDIFGAITASAGDPAVVAGAAIAAANAVADGILTLSGLGVGHFAVFNLPALDMTPQFTQITPDARPLAQLGTTFFNDTLDARLATLPAGPQVQPIDTLGLFSMLINDPTQYGLTNATDPCINPSVPSICTPEQADDWAFYDPVHPNRVVHEELANVVREFVAPVPLPLPGVLLIGGLVLMAGLRLRARG
jgi:outer membrane lipase/esterase